MSRLSRNFALWTALFALALMSLWIEATAARSGNVAPAANATQTPSPTPTPEKKKKSKKKTEEASPTPTPAATPEKGSTKTTPKAAPAGAPSQSEIAAAQASGKVWVNLDSGVYHKGGQWYGNTKNGKIMTEADAQKAGYREAQK